MTRLDLSYWDNVLNVIYKANEHLEQFDCFRVEVLKEIQRAIRTHSLSFFLFDDTLRPTNPIAINLAKQHLQSYQTYYHRLNPFDPIYVRVPSRWVLLDTDVSVYSEFKNSRIFTEFLKPQHTVRQMMVYLKSSQKLLGFIGLHRSDERDRFSDIEMSIAERIAPFLSQSLEKARLFREARDRAGMVHAFLDKMPMGLAILDLNFNTIFKNRKADRIFSEFEKNGIPLQDFEIKKRLLPAIIYQKCLELRKVAGFPGRDGLHRSMNFSVPLSKKTIYSVHVEILRDYDANKTSPVYFISLDEHMTKNNSEINEELMKNKFGLTYREIEIISFLFKGFKNSEIAELLSIRSGTVKNHLKKIFSKMGVNTRTSLIYEALSISGD